MGRGMSVIGGQLAPFPGADSAITNSPTAVPQVAAAPVDLGNVTLPGGDVGKLILGTFTVVSGGAGTVVFHLFRGQNGATPTELDATDIYSQDIFASSDQEVVHVHFYDDVPGPDPVTYSIRADSDVATATVAARRVTAVHAPGNTS